MRLRRFVAQLPLLLAVLFAAGLGTVAGASTSGTILGLPDVDLTVQAQASRNLLLGSAGLTQVKVDTNNNVILNNTGSALATNATNGFVYVTTSAGIPTGVPASLPTGARPLHVDTTNNVLYFYSGSWIKSSAGSAASTWASSLSAGNTSGGTNPTLSSGDQLVTASGSQSTSKPWLALSGQTQTATSGTVILYASASATAQDGGTTSTTAVQGISLTPTYNYTAASRTGSTCDIFVNRTDTSLGTGTNRFLTFQTASTDRLFITNLGELSVNVTSTASGNGVGIRATQNATAVYGNAAEFLMPVTPTSDGFSCALRVEGHPQSAFGSARYQIFVGDDTVGVAAGKGGGIGFYGYTDNSSATGFGSIQGIKENSGASDAASAMLFTTRTNAAAIAEKLRITSVGEVNLGGITTVGTVGYVLTRSDAVYQFANGTGTGATADTGISRDAAGVVDVGTGAQGNTGGTLKFTTATMVGKVGTYNNVATAGQGVTTVYGAGRQTGQTAQDASIATYTPAADGSFIVSCNINVTTSTTHNFTVECAYTDEGGTARVATFSVEQLAGTIINNITNVTGAGPYEGIPLHIRAKGTNAITIRTNAAGTYTTVTYNADGAIRQIQ